MSVSLPIRLPTYRIPFYHTVGQGVYISEQFVRWISLVKSESGVRVDEACEEPVQEGNLLDALTRLVGRVQLRSPLVAAHLDPAHVRCFMAVKSQSDNEAEWLAKEVRRRTPDGIPLSEFVIRSRSLVGPLEEGGRGHPEVSVSRASIAGEPLEDRRLIAAARRTAVLDRANLIRQVGLEPIVIGDVRADAHLAFAFDSIFAESNQSIVLFTGEDAWHIRQRGGVPRAAPERVEVASLLADSPLAGDSVGGDPVGSGRSTCRGIGEITSTLVRGSEVPISLTGPLVRSPDSVKSSGEGDSSGEEESSGEKESRVEPPYAPALALALTHAYSGAECINFLDSTATAHARDLEDKGEAVRALTHLWGLILIVSLTIFAGSAFIKFKAEEAAENLGAFEGPLERVEVARKETQALRERLTALEALVDERTAFAGVTERIGRSVPLRVRLHDVTLVAGHNTTTSAQAAPPNADDSRASTGVSQVRITISGTALEESSTADFLRRLESVAELERVQLRYTERLSEGELSEEGTSLRPASRSHESGPTTRRSAVSQFEIEAWYYLPGQ